MLPLLELLSDGTDHEIKALTAQLADRFGLTEEERNTRVPSGQQTTIHNRVSWARSYLKYADLCESPSRGRVRITKQGLEVLREKPQAITTKFLARFPSFSELKNRPKAKAAVEGKAIVPPRIDDARTPHELIDESYQSLREKTAIDLLERLRTCSPAFFERIVVDLLMRMGYGGVAGQGMVTGKAGDGGIDGVIKQDKLGLDVVCIQAKRWEGVVGRPTIQGFVGSMESMGSNKGVMLTTSSFSKDAVEYAGRILKKVVLVDGEELADLMIDHNLGITITKTYELKEVSNDFFDEGED